MPPPAAPATGPPTWPPSAPPSSRPSKTPATCTSPKAAATTPPRPKPSASIASIRTDANIHGTRRSPARLPAWNGPGNGRAKKSGKRANYPDGRPERALSCRDESALCRTPIRTGRSAPDIGSRQRRRQRAPIRRYVGDTHGCHAIAMCCLYPPQDRLLGPRLTVVTLHAGRMMPVRLFPGGSLGRMLRVIIGLLSVTRGGGVMISEGCVYRRCGCTDPDTGRQYGRPCPRLAAGGRHGSWYIRLELPPGLDGHPRRLPRGGYPSRKVAVA